MFLHLALTAGAAETDCSLSEPDYYDLRDQLRQLRRGEGESIGVAAQGEECERALDAVIRNGPFLGVNRVDSTSVREGECVAVLRPGVGGYTLATFGECRADPSGPSRMVTAGWWAPYGGTVRWNEDLGYGLSLVIDAGLQGYGGETTPFDLGKNAAPRHYSSVRGLVGLDITQEGLAGTYVGVRGGVESGLTTDGPVAETALVSFILGRKWIGNGIATQLGGGIVSEMPIGLGPMPESIYPVAELRLGLANRR